MNISRAVEELQVWYAQNNNANFDHIFDKIYQILAQYGVSKEELVMRPSIHEILTKVAKSELESCDKDEEMALSNNIKAKWGRVPIYSRLDW